MNKSKALLPLFFVLLAVAPARAEAPSAAVHHDLQVAVAPEEHRFTAVDTVTLPPGRESVTFRLHPGLGPASPTPGVEIREGEGGVYQVRLPAGANRFVLRYGGRLDYELEAREKEYARGFRRTRGRIAPEGVYLTGASGWYPDFGEKFLSFDLRVRLPEGWKAVSQGSRTRPGEEVRWQAVTPQEQIFLIAAPFAEYTRPAGKVEAMVFLRRPEPELAEKYLAATAQYLRMYEELIGPYPYAKFALVENFWETGFGMPSFTLLGPRVIRFPFILYSSYPHEILHNWWGNSVYPEYGAGNWAEGLTAYLADHLLKAQRGQGAEYRQTVLQKYTDYVSSEKDFPLTEFTARHSSATEAVGYGKSMMFFHMLRLQLGDEGFKEGLRELYRRYKFDYASFGDLEQVFSEAAGRSLAAEFGQWVTRTGAPELAVEEVRVREEGDGYRLTVAVRQRQPGPSYRLRVPVAVTLEGEKQARLEIVEVGEREQEVELVLPARPLRLDLDPRYDVFRKLNRAEIPPALSQVFGAEEIVAVLPSSAAGERTAAYRRFAAALRHAGPEKVNVVLDRELERLPADKTVVLLGWDNRFRETVAEQIAGYGAAVAPGRLQAGGETAAGPDLSAVLTVRHPANPELVLAWIEAGTLEALPGLARKLPHYHKYSYLAFRGSEPENAAKGRWPVLASPMSVFIGAERPGMGELPERKPLADLPPVFSKERLAATVRFLADPALEGRGFGTAGLDEAARFLAGAFAELGLEPAGGADGYIQSFRARGGEPEQEAVVKNVVGVIPGADPALAGRPVIVGAHFDHLGRGWPDVREGNRGKIHPGASDNASGVAVLLELARVLAAGPRPARSILFAAFSGEEAGRLGSRYFVENFKAYPPEEAIGMINLDTVGHLGEGPLLVLGADSAREWPHIFRGAGYVAGVGVKSVGRDLDASDQESFHEAGVPAVQLFSGPHPSYHQPADTPGTIDAEGLVQVAAVAREAIAYLAGRAEPLTSRLAAGEEAPQAPPARSERRVSLGTVPDFAFEGEGCRISGVTPGSPAEAAGLREGDVIVGLADRPVRSLQDLSDIMKKLAPGETVSLSCRRQGEEVTVRIEPVER